MRKRRSFKLSTISGRAFIVSEEWRPVVGWEGLYEVSSLGRLRSIARTIVQGSRWGGTISYEKRGAVLRPGRTPGGYRTVNLYDNNRRYCTYVHALVLEAFVGPRPSGSQVRHLNGVDAGDGLANLAYGTPTENCADKKRHGTQTFGETHGTHRLTEAEVRGIRAAPGFHKDIAARYGICKGHVGDIRARKYWKHV